jgi:thymidylate synthase (FAD)
MKRYKEALDLGIAKECARFFLPLSTQTKMYVKGSVRNFIHYCSVRMAKETQLEHRVIAQEIWKLVVEQLPTVAKAVEV